MRLTAQYLQYFAHQISTYNHVPHYVCSRLAGEIHSKKWNVLDLGCGIGIQDIDIARLGHVVTGVDYSEFELNMFRQRLSGEPKELQDRVRLFQDNWLRPQMGWDVSGSYDLVCMFANALGLAGSEENMDITFALISNVLKFGGYLAFDQSSYDYIVADQPPVWSDPVTIAELGVKFRRALTRKVMGEKIWNLTLHIEELDSNGKPINYKTESTMYYEYTFDDILRLLTKYGFEVFECYDPDAKIITNASPEYKLWFLRKV